MFVYFFSHIDTHRRTCILCLYVSRLRLGHTHTHTHMCSRCILSGLKSIFSLILLFNKKSAAGTPICVLIFVIFFFHTRLRSYRKVFRQRKICLCVGLCCLFSYAAFDTVVYCSGCTVGCKIFGRLQ